MLKKGNKGNKGNKGKVKSRSSLSNKSSILAAFKEHVLVTLEENHTFQIKQDNLVQRIRYTDAFIEDAENAIRDKEKENLDLNEWLAYLACDAIPKAFKPEAIRQFFDKVDYFEEQNVKLTVNWLLAIDERSVLNQDIDSVNLTKRVLKESRVNFGLQYDERVNNTITILRRIEDFLDKPTRVLSERILCDVKEMKSSACNKINNYIDNLTYRVLCSENAYMESIDVTSAEYTYEGRDFDIHLWTFQNVPIYLHPLDTPSKTINFYQIKIKLVMPFSALCENMVIRGLHSHFDHFSSRARFYKLPKSNDAEKRLRKCLQDEWESQKKIQADVKLTMIKQRADFEETARIKKEEEELKLKLLKKQQQESGAKEPPKKISDKPPKLKKQPKEPPIVTPDVVPLVRMDFLHQESLEHDEMMSECHPHQFKLTKGEINLRKFQILGGVYQINCLSKPKVTNFPKLIMTWYKTNKHVEYKTMKSEIDTSKSLDVLQFFKITFELDECFCFWGEPIPCVFEEGITDTKTEQSEISKVINSGSPIIINDFNLHDLFTKSLMYDFIETTIPRVISSFQFPDDLYDEEEDKKTKATLGRTKMTAEEQEKEKELLMQKHMMFFEHQNCPERLFPLFKKVLPVIILPIEEENQNARLHPYEHFSDFMSALESIKESYRKSTFKDSRGNIINISAEHYAKNIRQPRKSTITNKFIVQERSSDEHSIEYGSSKESIHKRDTKRGTILTKSSHVFLSGEETRSKIRLGNQKRQSTKLRASEYKLVGSNEEIKEVENTTTEPRWSTVNILKSEFKADKRKVTIWTDRLGTFGFAFDRYQHFPFERWSLQPREENPKEVEFLIETKYAIFRIYVTPDGYKVSVTDFTKYVKKRKIYLEITEPKLREKNLNIFPEHDACWYITGYFSEKHLAAELHTYNCISLYSTSLKFLHSLWNKLSARRNMVLKLGELRDLEEDLFLIRVTPEDVVFVDVKEVCTELSVTELEYTPTWRNLEWYPDLNHLILSTFGDAVDMRVKDPSMIFYMKNILHAVKPLSCS